VRLGEHNIVPNYFEQNQAEALDLNTSVLDTLVRSAPNAKINDLKQLLGRMLFSGNAMEKKVGKEVKLRTALGQRLGDRCRGGSCTWSAGCMLTCDVMEGVAVVVKPRKTS
jgi:hypothetical protein